MAPVSLSCAPASGCSRLSRVTWVASRILGAALLTGFVMVIGCVALFFTTAPRALSLAVEPISLLLMPGLVISLATAGSHDIPPEQILRVSSAVYFLFFSFLLLRRPRTHKPSR